MTFKSTKLQMVVFEYQKVNFIFYFTPLTYLVSGDFSFLVYLLNASGNLSIFSFTSVGTSVNQLQHMKLMKTSICFFLFRAQSMGAVGRM